MTSAAVKTAMRRGTRSVRASAESKPDSPEIGLTMQFTASLDQRPPQRVVVTLVGATSFMWRASPCPHAVYAPPKCSHLVEDVHPGREGDGHGRYQDALIVMTQ